MHVLAIGVDKYRMKRLLAQLRELVRKQPSANAKGASALNPVFEVRVVEPIVAWAVIACDGVKLGYFPADAAQRQ